MRRLAIPAAAAVLLAAAVPAAAQFGEYGLGPDLKIGGVNTKPRKAGSRHVKVLGFSVYNEGGFPAEKAVACVSLSTGYKVVSRPSGSKVSGRKICFAPASLDAGEKAAYRVVANVPRRASANYAAKVSVTAENADTIRQSIALTVYE